MSSPAQATPQRPSSAATALARQLTDALAAATSGKAGSADVRKAALFEQMTARHLAKLPASRRRDVLAHLGAETRAQLTADITAAQELMAMTTPQPKLPAWRVLTPAPPTELLADYHRAEKATGTPWYYLAAVNLVESRMGRIRGTSTAGAQGPMQFLPTTFEMYSKGGDINDPADAILAAGRMLAHNGAPGDMRGALWSYNQSRRYGDAVRIYAEQMKRSPKAYQLYWHWQVLYSAKQGTVLLPEGYPGQQATRIAE